MGQFQHRILMRHATYNLHVFLLLRRISPSTCNADEALRVSMIYATYQPKTRS